MKSSKIKNKKIKILKDILRSLKSVVVSYSGGVDSTFLLKVAFDALGKDNVLAVIAKSETYPKREFKTALELAKKIGSRYKIILTKELNIKGYNQNPVNRCYYCKKELMKRLKNIAKKNRLMHVVDGTNYDDRLDTRYGKRALKELGIESPLYKSRITKNEIRRFSKTLGLPTFNKPSFACLASRIPHHTKITAKRLERVDLAESFLQKLGFRQVRVRDYGDLARIEVEKPFIEKFLKIDLNKINRYFNNLGYRYITLDLAGYRTGSMNVS